MNVQSSTQAILQGYRVDTDPEILYRIFEYAPDAIFVVDAEGCIRKANAQVEAMFGYTREELLGRLIEVLVPERFAQRHTGYRAGYATKPRTRPMGAGLELYGRRKDGTEFPVDIMLSPITVQESTTLFLAVVRDATERKRVESEALHTRETYLKEVHHRVKNNLQVISSLLYLQSTYTKDGQLVEMLKESQSRVKSIALIHEKLYRSPQLVTLDFGDYIRDLVADVMRTYVNPSVVVDIRIDTMTLEIDTAIPCGLIVNELVSNALKYAFPAGRAGTIRVELSAAGPQTYLLVVSDDGVGMPPGVDVATTKSLGLRLVSDLTRQLEGSMSIENRNGTTFRITFRELQYKDRG